MPNPNSQQGASPTISGAQGQPTTAPAREPGTLRKLWNWMNQGLISKETMIGALTGMTPQQLNEALSPFDSETPGHAAIREFTRGALQDTGATASSFTSPLSIGMMGAGALGKAPGAVGAIAKVAKVSPEALGVAGRVGSALAGSGFGVLGAQDIYNAGLSNTPEAGAVPYGKSDEQPQSGRLLYQARAATDRRPAAAGEHIPHAGRHTLLAADTWTG